MSPVTLTFEVWIQVKVTAHHLTIEDNIYIKLHGNPSMYKLQLRHEMLRKNRQT